MHEPTSVEAALRASEERLRYFVEHAQDIIYYCDLDGRFTYVNPTAARVMKYAEGELLGRHFMTFVRRDDRPRAGDLYTRQMMERIPNTYFEFAAVTKDGSTVWLGQHVQLAYDGETLIGVQAIARDITRQREFQDQLRHSEARYRSLIQGAAYGIYRTRLDGVILDANPALAAMLGYSAVEELITHNMGDVYASPADRAEIIQRYNNEGAAPASLDMNWKKKDGTPIVAHVTARVVDTADGSVCFEGIVEDITARRALEDQLRQAQKMEAVGRLARGVAHDFNNVLAAVLGCAELLAMRLKKDDPARQDAEEIQKAAERGAALTRQLLAFSRRQPLEPQLVNLHEVVSGIDKMLLRLTGDVELSIHTPGEAPIVRMEPGQIEQVLLNLVVNARDAMAEGSTAGGAIVVTVDSVTLDARGIKAHPGMRPGRYARISVSDTGAGISPEMQRLVFEPFFSTKDPAKGSGLGLSIVYGIAKEAGGTVTLASETGTHHGTRFEVLLPIGGALRSGELR